MEELCDAIAETDVNPLSHTEVYMCELKPGHEGNHRVTIEWAGGEWVKITNDEE
jgi:hypothetical protein